MINTHDFELAAAIGNLVQRCLTFVTKEFDGVIPNESYEEIFSVSELKAEVDAEFQKYRLQSAIERAFSRVKATNKYLTDEAPWLQKGDENKSKRAKTVRTVLESIYICGHFFYPIIPTAMQQMYAALNTPMTTLDNLKGWGNLKPGTAIKPTTEVLFQRVQDPRWIKEQTKGKNAPTKVVNDISRWHLVVGKILSCKKHPDSDHLYVEEMDVGGPKPLQIVSGLAKFIPIEEMTGRLVIVVLNMKPAKLRGVQSEGMVVAANNEGSTVVELVTPPNGSVPGERIKFAGYPDDNATQQLNSNVISKVKEFLKTDDNCVAGYRGVPFTTSAGVCKVLTLKNAQLG